MTTINHWGKWIDSDVPVTGVLSFHSLDLDAYPFKSEICLDCEEAYKAIKKQYRGARREEELESVECDSSHTKIIGEWKKDRHGKYYPNPKGEYAAIVNESTVQVVYSHVTTRGNVCSPCYPGQVDLDSKGDFLAYTLPDDMLYKEDK